jgi:hypothetical protein
MKANKMKGSGVMAKKKRKKISLAAIMKIM